CIYSGLSLSSIPLLQCPPLFPYTTLFRSAISCYSIIVKCAAGRRSQAERALEQPQRRVVVPLRLEARVLRDPLQPHTDGHLPGGYLVPAIRGEAAQGAQHGLKCRVVRRVHGTDLEAVLIVAQPGVERPEEHDSQPVQLAELSPAEHLHV